MSLVQKRGYINLLVSIVIAGFVIAGLFAWFISFRKSTDTSEKEMTALAIAKMEWEKLNNMSVEELEEKRAELIRPYIVDGYEVHISLGTKGRFKNGQCMASVTDAKYASCITDSYLKISRDGEVLYATKTIPLGAEVNSKEVLNNELNGYVRNDEFKDSSQKGSLSFDIAYGENGKKFVQTKLDGVEVPLYKSEELLGPPDLTQKRNIDLPWTVPETGYIFIHHTAGGQTKINAITADGITIDGLLSFNVVGLFWTPVSKGDYLYWVSKNSYIDKFYFVPCIKTKS